MPDLILTEDQSKAFRMTLEHPLSVLTGGPGTGKTTILKSVVEAFEKAGLSVALAAPTGKAAKRMTEQIGWPAKTVHRLLGAGMEGFGRGRDNPIDADVVIVDESSFLDISLARHFFDAIDPKRTRVLLIGDVDQLPSVGPGRVLHDLIESGVCPVSRLTEIMRQDEAGDIVWNAHRIHEGKKLDIRGKGDFHFIPCEEPRDIRTVILDLVRAKPREYGLDPAVDVQVLCPMKRGMIGVTDLGRDVGTVLNPNGRKIDGQDFRTGDKVIQTRNDYGMLLFDERISRSGIDLVRRYAAERASRDDILRELRQIGEAESGIFNGEIGIVEGGDAKFIRVRFDDRWAEYPAKAAREDLMTAWAITIHRSQGSEYPMVVIPIHTSHYMMLVRNLIYTGVTRGTKYVFLIGSPKAVNMAIRNNSIVKRNTSLKERLKGV